MLKSLISFAHFFSVEFLNCVCSPSNVPFIIFDLDVIQNHCFGLLDQLLVETVQQIQSLLQSLREKLTSKKFHNDNWQIQTQVELINVSKPSMLYLHLFIFTALYVFGEENLVQLCIIALTQICEKGFCGDNSTKFIALRHIQFHASQLINILCFTYFH